MNIAKIDLKLGMNKIHTTGKKQEIPDNWKQTHHKYPGHLMTQQSPYKIQRIT